MAQIPNAAAFTLSDGANTYINVDTLNKIMAVSGMITAYGQSATAPAIANGNTIATAGLSVSRVAPAAAVTGIILQAGTQAGQEVTVINESGSTFTVTFAASGTSNVADGVSDVIAVLTARSFVWDAGTNLWYRIG